MTTPFYAPASVQFTAGQYPQDADMMSQLSNALTFFNGAPAFRAQQTTAQSLTTATWTAMSLQNKIEDNYNGYGPNQTPAQSNSRYVAQIPGWYWIQGQICWVTTSSTTCIGIAGVRINGTANLPIEGMEVPGTSLFGWSAIYSGYQYLKQGDYVELMGYQTSGGALSTNVTVANGPLSTLSLYYRSA